MSSTSSSSTTAQRNRQSSSNSGGNRNQHEYDSDCEVSESPLLEDGNHNISNNNLEEESDEGTYDGLLSWRSDSCDSFSDWTIEVTVTNNNIAALDQSISSLGESTVLSLGRRNKIIDKKDNNNSRDISNPKISTSAAAEETSEAAAASQNNANSAVAEVKKYHVHKCILAKPSKYFAAVFRNTNNNNDDGLLLDSNNFLESKDNTTRVEFDEEIASAIPELLDFLYPSDTRYVFQNKFVPALYCLSNYFDITFLPKRIRQFFDDHEEAATALDNTGSGGGSAYLYKYESSQNESTGENINLHYNYNTNYIHNYNMASRSSCTNSNTSFSSTNSKHNNKMGSHFFDDHMLSMLYCEAVYFEDREMLSWIENKCATNMGLINSTSPLLSTVDPKFFYRVIKKQRQARERSRRREHRQKNRRNSNTSTNRGVRTRDRDRDRDRDHDRDYPQYNLENSNISYINCDIIEITCVVVSYCVQQKDKLDYRMFCKLTSEDFISIVCCNHALELLQLEHYISSNNNKNKNCTNSNDVNQKHEDQEKSSSNNDNTDKDNKTKSESSSVDKNVTSKNNNFSDLQTRCIGFIKSNWYTFKEEEQSEKWKNRLLKLPHNVLVELLDFACKR